MKQQRGYWWVWFLCLMVVGGLQTAQAQHPYRSKRTIVRAGRMERTDSLSAQKADSLLWIRLDSLRTAEPALDSLLTQSLYDRNLLDSLQRRGIVPEVEADSLATLFKEHTSLNLSRWEQLEALRADSLSTLLPLSEEGRRAKGQGPRDTLSLPAMTWISTVAPGFGQIYNKQYWKLPILYGTLGASLTMFFHENKQYKPLKQQYDAITSQSTIRTEELDALQSKMIRHNTLRQIYLATSIASYLYFLGDAAVNYRFDATEVQKATTLACIFPGAGQIYNKSYWRLPFVVGGLATTIYCVDWNNRGYQRFKKAYALRTAYDQAMENHRNDPENFPEPEGGSTDEFRGRYTADFLKNLKDNYRRNRDLCLIITAGVYILQIIDAHVDAHLKSYDISDDLSMSITPAMDYTYSPVAGQDAPVFGFNVSLNF